MLEQLRAHGELLGWLFATSVTLFFLTLVLLPVLVVQIPADYFSSRRRLTSGRPLWRSPLRLLFHLTKNLVGVCLVILGVILLVLPGQGLLTILLGIILMDFPGKYRLERWLVSRPGVRSSINWLRKRFGHPPLEIGADSGV